jgi:hypothetical protein
MPIDPLTVECRMCGALENNPCTRGSNDSAERTEREPHPARRDAAERAARIAQGSKYAGIHAFTSKRAMRRQQKESRRA